MQNARIRWGSSDVPLLRKPWVSAPREPYRKTYCLNPGQSWFEAPATPDQWQDYPVGPDGRGVPAGAISADELVAEGAEQAVFVEMWGGVVFVGPDLVCVARDGRLGAVLDDYVEANDRTPTGAKSSAGFPDVLAIFPDGRIAFREIKRAGKDRLQQRQHRAADVLRDIFGPRADLAVIEWGYQ